MQQNLNTPSRSRDVGKKKHQFFLSSYKEQVREEQRDNNSSVTAPYTKHSVFFHALRKVDSTRLPQPLAFRYQLQQCLTYSHHKSFS